MLKRIAPAAFLMLAAAGLARANDSSAELATGGLVLTTNDAIEMRSEDLYVSPAQIRVNYVFHNPTDHDVTTLIAFPMPDIVVDGPDAQITVPTQDAQNLLGFTAKINGDPVSTHVEQKVFANGAERTDVLRRLNVPLAPHLQSTQAAIDALPPAAQDELQKLNMVEVDEYDVGKGMERHLAPRWTLKTTYFWNQTFPKQSDTAIEHTYAPSVGGSAQTLLGRDEKAMRGDDGSLKEELARYSTKYCTDDSFLSTVASARKAAKQDYAPFSELRISYILKTGANWSRPIGSFRIVVDKLHPGNLVSFCGDGVKKISPTQFEMTKKDFTPKSDLDVLILVPLVPT
jgi:hypothetical protein